jgi:hypothetical protein
VGVDQLALLFQGQDAAVVGQRMDHYGGVLAGFHHFVEIADGAVAGGDGQGAVLPFCAGGGEQEAADQIAGCHVFVAGHGDEWLAQRVRHVFNKPGFAAAGGAF